ncbi:hypothetical protein [uncultured Corynebacterium sp.]|uniref:hypothetical protein n=1 Tax=uncultured Corynebacterium sp. TaxID=159447 RepID=UPI0026052D4F|nr:hypothetical protein [uncultured Corynebacterium sp.]
MAAHYFPGPTISKRYTTLRDATGYAAQMFYFTLGLVATNVHLIVAQGADDAFENGVDPEPPKPRRRRYSDDLEPEDKDLSWNGIEFLPPPVNAPPLAA